MPCRNQRSYRVRGERRRTRARRLAKAQDQRASELDAYLRQKERLAAALADDTAILQGVQA
jgi:hypothetical protein